MSPENLQLFPAPKRLRLTGEASRLAALPEAGALPVRMEPQLPPQGYRLSIEPEALQVAAADEAGGFYARQTLQQILRQCDGPPPCLEIEDAPDLPIRGIMLDVSRCKVPTLETLREWIHWMASLKLNQLQLYIEHTFAFPGHETVWQEASPYTPEDIRQIDTWCRDCHIELVPNLNSFGHMERWLRHAPYRHLAECPEGFTHPATREAVPHGSTLYPDQQALAFLEGLYDAYLPCFQSRTFNVGGDEPWELGQGRSRGAVEERGKGAVYLDFLKGIHQLVTSRGRTMQCWADILLEHPEVLPELPRDLVPVIWGYRAAHPFQKQAAEVARHVPAFHVAPGNNTWNSFTGRLNEAIGNMNAAARAGRDHRASGYLMTTWGDNGNHQPWITLYPGLVQGACASWGVDLNADVDLEAYFATHFFKDPELAAALIQLGHLEDDLPLPRHNWQAHRSPTHYYLFTPPEQLLAGLKRHGTQPKRSQLAAFEKRAAQLEKQLPPAGESDSPALAEIRLGLGLAVLGARRIAQLLYRADDPFLKVDTALFVGEYARIWPLRARPGGLKESLACFP